MPAIYAGRTVPGMPALDALRDRLAELSDLHALARLAAWDQRTMMPPRGAPARAHQVATLQRLVHDRETDEQIGAWLDELDADGDGLDALGRDLVRVARRDWDRARRVPRELASDLALAAAEGQAAWMAARAASDFAAFAPALRRNVDLAREYAACFPDAAHPYDAHLADYDFGLTAARVREIFDPLAERLSALAAEAADGPAVPPLSVPIPAQRAAVDAVLARLGVTEDSWRVDVSAHPFTSWLSAQDTRVTTRFNPEAHLESVLAAMHEYGHALYERQIPPELQRTNVGRGPSMSAHESQSKLWENHVGRNPAFAPVIAAELATGGFQIEPEALHAATVAVKPSLIRVSADPLTYPLHIVLRFDLEVALMEGSLDVADLPAAWADGMRRLLGVEVPDDAHGVLQDMHWSGGAFGYFPSYALGCLIAAQLWEALEADIGRQDDNLRAGDCAAIRGWLAEHVHRHGRRLDTEPLVEAATGRGIDPEPFLRHVTPYARA
jgi:carboxypeptidase Taq